MTDEAFSVKFNQLEQFELQFPHLKPDIEHLRALSAKLEAEIQRGIRNRTPVPTLDPAVRATWENYFARENL